MYEQSKMNEQDFFKMNVAIWKFNSLIQLMNIKGTLVPSMALAVHAGLAFNNHTHDIDTINSTYASCANKVPALGKQLNRLAYLRYELLTLMDYYKNIETNNEEIKEINDLLNIYPITDVLMLKLEVGLIAKIHRFTASGVELSKLAIHDKKIKFTTGQLSNKIFSMIKLGRELKSQEDKNIIIDLIVCQYTLLQLMVYLISVNNINHSVPYTKIMKIIHWQPKDIDEAKAKLKDGNEYLAKYTPIKEESTNVFNYTQSVDHNNELQYAG